MHVANKVAHKGVRPRLANNKGAKFLHQLQCLPPSFNFKLVSGALTLDLGLPK